MSDATTPRRFWLMHCIWLRSALWRWKRSLERRLAEIDCLAPERSSGDRSEYPDLGNELRAILQQVARKYPGRPLIAYGSRVSGVADAHSDLDVLVIEYDRNAPPRHTAIQSQGLEIDVTRVGFNVVLKGLKSRGAANNRWFLNALCESYIYGDYEGEAQQLRYMAKQIWEAGPPALTRKQVEATRIGLLRLQYGAEKLCARAGESPEAARLAYMRCDHLATQAIYVFYCMRGRWTTSLHRLLERCQQDYPEFYSLWRRYAVAAEPETALATAAQLVAAVYEGLFPPEPALQNAEINLTVLEHVNKEARPSVSNRSQTAGEGLSV